MTDLPEGKGPWAVECLDCHAPSNQYRRIYHPAVAVCINDECRSTHLAFSELIIPTPQRDISDSPAPQVRGIQSF
jgi:hypothetical protein